jgi:hypothetical protein
MTLNQLPNLPSAAEDSAADGRFASGSGFWRGHGSGYGHHAVGVYMHEGKYQVLCHNVTEFGGTWLVVKPNGRPAST